MSAGSTAAALFGWGLDWRQALLLIGVVLLAVAPLHAWALRGPMLVAGPVQADAQADNTLHEALHHASFWLLALWAHVRSAFADKGVSTADALIVVMTVGPAQVAGRLLYVWLGRGWPLRTLGAWVLGALPVFAVIFDMANGLLACAAAPIAATALLLVLPGLL